jgi:hypothetical protein
MKNDIQFCKLQFKTGETIREDLLFDCFKFTINLINSVALSTEPRLDSIPEKY